MARFFVAPDKIQDTEVIISGEDVKHITKVLRLGPGDNITVLDGVGNEYLVKIRALAAGLVQGQILQRSLATSEAPIRVTLIQGLPKGEKMELIIQKAVELGVYRIAPVETTRSIVKLDAKKAEQRRERWQRVSMEAAKQSRRFIIPSVEPILSFNRALAEIPKEAVVLMAWEEASQPLKPVLTQLKSGIKGAKNLEIYLIVGPEGGFTPEEARAAKESGALIISLGPRILRTETAGLTALAVIMYELGDLGGVVDG